MGLGVLGGGLGVARFFAEYGAKVTVTDLKNKEELKDPLLELAPFDIKYVLGRHDENDFRSHDLVIRNPAVPQDSPYLKIAESEKIPVEMESSIFFMLCPTKKIIGVTGTKGKTTTTILIGQILEEAKKNVVIGGNLRIPMLELIDKITKDTWVVLELSSWQLEGLSPHKTSPHVAVITNIMPDHLNRYGSFEDYIEAKKIICQFQTKNDYLVTSGDEGVTRKIAAQAKSKVVLYFRENLPAKIRRAIKIPGAHNILNVSCAYETVKILGVSDDNIFNVVDKFQGVADRLEQVSIKKGVTFINDTTATTPEATVAAISSYSRPIILICGGADKDLMFKDLGEAINKKVKMVALLEGSATGKIEKEIRKELIIGRFSNFEKAVRSATEKANLGEIVLLSPACASFGLFRNEFDRGGQFREIVRSL